MADRINTLERQSANLNALPIARAVLPFLSKKAEISYFLPYPDDQRRKRSEVPPSTEAIIRKLNDSQSLPPSVMSEFMKLVGG